MNLTVAIPVHNDFEHLMRLLGHLEEMRIADAIIVVDDGSDIPLDRSIVRKRTGLPADRFKLLRHDEPCGPGPARNRALSHVRTDHVLFLDADDLPTWELPWLLQDLEGKRFDFCIFRHHDTRSEQEDGWGPARHDRELWRAAGTDLGALATVSSPAAAFLAQTANYPWNKIYRTSFLRDNGIGCSDILVHEDVELHWRGFLEARTILASDRIGIIHFVQPGGGRLTNHTGAERLAVFGPANELASRLSARRDERFFLPFHLFIFRLFDWILGNLETAHHPRFHGLVRDFATAHVSAPLLERLRSEIPQIIDRLLAEDGERGGRGI